MMTNEADFFKQEAECRDVWDSVVEDFETDERRFGEVLRKYALACALRDGIDNLFVAKVLAWAGMKLITDCMEKERTGGDHE